MQIPAIQTSPLAIQASNLLEVISLEQALEKGLTRYYTGIKCKKGHQSQRYTALGIYAKNGQCCMCIKEYQQKHYEKLHSQREKTRPRPDACETCGRVQDYPKLAWDHCHTTGKFRGWLCRQCNYALGLVKDNPKTLIKLSEYLIQNR